MKKDFNVNYIQYLVAPVISSGRINNVLKDKKNTVICMNSQLTVSFGRYKEHVLYGTPCGEYVDGTQICDHGCDGCVAGQNFWDEVV